MFIALSNNKPSFVACQHANPVSFFGALPNRNGAWINPDPSIFMN